MTLAEFLVWNPPGGQMWQLDDGEPQAMAPANRTHGALLAELGALIGNHLKNQANPCTVVVLTGVIPHVQSDTNIRIPDLAVPCSAYEREETALTDPVLLIEILSPTNQAETWSNVWTYTTFPSVREILVVKTVGIGAELLRRNPDGTWPKRPLTVESCELVLGSIKFRAAIEALYRTTRLARQ